MPPSVKRQTPTPAPPAPRRTGKAPTRDSSGTDEIDALFGRAVPVSEIVSDYLKVMIYGQNGTGKTTLACLFPKPLLLLSFEPSNTGGAKSVKRTPGVTYLKLGSKREAELMVAGLREPDRLLSGVRVGDFRTHVIDTATQMQEHVLADILGVPTEDMPTQLGFGRVKMDQHTEKAEKTKDLLKGFMSLPANTVVLCQERDHNPQRDMSISRALKDTGAFFQMESFLSGDLGGGAIRWLSDKADYIFRLYSDKEVVTEQKEQRVPGRSARPITITRETGKEIRHLRLQFSKNFAGRCRADFNASIPEFVAAKTPQHLYDAMMAVIDSDLKREV